LLKPQGSEAFTHSRYYSKDVLAKNNAQLVERIVRIAKEFRREIATPQESRKILNLL
jgi:3-keto-5-aminohexanoate cleavage enzyme